jgi:CRP-like cAMP-binding protein
MAKKVHVDHLRNAPLFSECSRKDLGKIATHSDVVELPAGRVLMHQGMQGSEAFVVLKGRISVRRHGRLVTELGEGAMVGELALLDQGPRTATVTCLTDCSLLVLSRGALLGALDDVPVLTHKLFEALAARLRDLDQRSFV